MCSEGLVEAYIQAVAPVPIWVYGSRPGPVVWVHITRDDERTPRAKLLAEDERCAKAVIWEARAWMRPYRRAIGGYALEPCTAVAIVREAARHLGAGIQDEDELRLEAAEAVRRFEEEFSRIARSGGLREVNRQYRQHRADMLAAGKNAMPYPRWMAARKLELFRISAPELRRVKIADFAGPGAR